MAKLDPKPYPGDWSWHEGESADAWTKRTEKLLKQINKKQPKPPYKTILGARLRFPAETATQSMS